GRDCLLPDRQSLHSPEGLRVIGKQSIADRLDQMVLDAIDCRCGSERLAIRVREVESTVTLDDSLVSSAYLPDQKPPGGKTLHRADDVVRMFRFDIHIILH